MAGPEAMRAVAMSRGRNDNPVPAFVLETAKRGKSSSNRMAWVKKKLELDQLLCTYGFIGARLTVNWLGT